MSYHIYNTEGLVLTSRSRREADKTYAILTRDLGLIYATAGGIRKESSKLRASLEPYSLSMISLVRGKEHWRITSASLELNIQVKLRKNKKLLVSFSQVMKLVSKLVIGESAHPELFDVAKNMANFIIKDGIKNEHSKGIEIVFLVRVLYELGYVSKSDIPVEIISGDLSEDLLKQANTFRRSLVDVVNNGIKSSSLADER